MELVRIVCHGNSLAFVREERDGAVLTFSRPHRSFRVRVPKLREVARRRENGDAEPFWDFLPAADDDAAWEPWTRREPGAYPGSRVHLEGSDALSGRLHMRCPRCGGKMVDLDEVYDHVLEARRTGRKQVYPLPA